DGLRFELIRELSLWRRRDQRFDVTNGVFAHCDHEFSSLDLAQWHHLPQFCERMNRYVLVFQNLGGFSTDPIEQASLSLDVINIDIERLCYPLLGGATLDSFQDHSMFLNDRESIDALVICERFIVCRNQA